MFGAVVALGFAVKIAILDVDPHSERHAAFGFQIAAGGRRLIGTMKSEHGDVAAFEHVGADLDFDV